MHHGQNRARREANVGGRGGVYLPPRVARRGARMMLMVTEPPDMVIIEWCVTSQQG